MEERGWDPRVKSYFKKILSSLGLGLIWIMSAVAGIYYGLASVDDQPISHTILFYGGLLITLILLIVYLYKTWKNG